MGVLLYEGENKWAMVYPTPAISPAYILRGPPYAISRALDWAWKPQDARGRGGTHVQIDACAYVCASVCAYSRRRRNTRGRSKREEVNFFGGMARNSETRLERDWDDIVG